MEGRTAKRPFQVVVWGATAYTGRMVCEHLAKIYQGNISWAIGGRNKQKLEGVRNHLAHINSICKDVPIITGDIKEQRTIDEAVSQADVVICCTGPYSLYGTPVVDACVRCGTDYVDLTGEVAWERRMVREYHDKAAERGVKIVHNCGFDSIPSDIGTQMVVHHIQQKLKSEPAKVEFVMGSQKGGVSGGTIASLLTTFYDEPPQERWAVQDPYCLDPPDSRRGPDGPDQTWPRYSSPARTWTMPFVMAPINTRVVRRSNALLGHSYGSNFSYQEDMRASNYVIAAVGSIIQTGLFAALYVPPVRSIFQRLLPASGQGPTKTQMREGYWKGEVYGTTTDGRVVVGDVAGHHDPAIWDTTRMLLESAICLATQREELKRAGMVAGGVLTPASAMGPVLLERLRKADFVFKVRDEGRTAGTPSSEE